MKTKQIYYVGHKKMCIPNDWGKTTEQAAINHAKQLCRDSGEPQIVVKIIAYIESEIVPIRVTKIK